MENRKRKYTTEELRNIRRKVMTITAYLIESSKYNRSKAMKVAWNMIKQVFYTKVNVSFGNRQTALNHLQHYNPRRIKITLQHEPTNPFDRNAIAVIVTVIGKDSYQVGYIKKAFAEVYALLLKKGLHIQATFEGITGENKVLIMVLISVMLCNRLCCL
ncbi:hypothetical protein AJ85_04745 [Alkalihalobacillus alcalophilus ATCC 27647 = CGMCC 1.3604]|uniref:HIRAN domain-containing protein n=1 Tax=Alkalihalobacillus alcalophilus ATCC 27647 = CGMCC 1.3604 TaxID=1218173 RepID=A0A4S4K1H8_ALKAL|nr:HIRAN domain-containing protein [Alkalihalobacillus alcalophilus]MED1563229.1 HIRAN domain-containing protein [Alkalihalobacillus alcalophilus]THG91463.1 hypothetical protein AJ85_04745 [Alkalihalobacillus alcalophilus ATCC 27647 = CGMCC 1.3604]